MALWLKIVSLFFTSVNKYIMIHRPCCKLSYFTFIFLSILINSKEKRIFSKVPFVLKSSWIRALVPALLKRRGHNINIIRWQMKKKSKTFPLPAHKWINLEQLNTTRDSSESNTHMSKSSSAKTKPNSLFCHTDPVKLYLETCCCKYHFISAMEEKWIDLKQ